MADNCKCIDCGGDQPGHTPDCEYMAELHSDPPHDCPFCVSATCPSCHPVDLNG